MSLTGLNFQTLVQRRISHVCYLVFAHLNSANHAHIHLVECDEAWSSVSHALPCVTSTVPLARDTIFVDKHNPERSLEAHAHSVTPTMNGQFSGVWVACWIFSRIAF